MLSTLNRWLVRPELRPWRNAIIVAGLLCAAAYVGRRSNPRILMLPILAVGGLMLVRRPALGLMALVTAALFVPRQLGTGTEVALNAASLLVPALLALWLADGLLRGAIAVVPSRVNVPLILFLCAGLFSLLVGNVLWDPTVPRPGNMTIVQIAQWAIFALSAGAFWLGANQLPDEGWLRRLVWTFLIVGGGGAIVRVLPGVGRLIDSYGTLAFDRSPLWALLAALAGGQLFFNHELSLGRRLYLLLVVAATLYYALVMRRETVSNMVGVGAALATLLWLRFPRLRIVSILVAVVVSIVLFSVLYDFAGGDDMWDESGGSRLVLIERVVEVTMRNPLTGLGPASYRPYAGSKPLMYFRAFWVNPQISSHNNYVDLFAHGGLLGLGLFAWFIWALGRLGWRLGERLRQGFIAGYVQGMLALLVASLALMLFADWILPFVYNIGFPGFQASVLVWLFLGGLVTVEQWTQDEAQP
jgi:hypothetical protein